MILKTGNIFDSTADVIVNPTNSVGIMGAGLAKQFIDRYPKACAEYNNWSVARWNPDPHRLMTAKTFNLAPPRLFEAGVFDADRAILMFATKRHPYNASTLEDIERNLIDTFEMLANDTNYNSIAFPKIGCGYGGLDWKDVKPLISNTSVIWGGEIICYVEDKDLEDCGCGGNCICS